MQNIAEIIIRTAENMPNYLAVVGGQDRLNYSQLSEMVLKTASCFKAGGVVKQQRVAVFSDKQIETVLSLFGSMACGAATVPINPVLKPLMAANIMENAAITALVTTSVRYEQLRPYLNKIPTLTLIIVIDKKQSLAIDNDKKYIRLLGWSEFLSLTNEIQPVEPVSMDELAAIFYTSGSTGHPKGVVFSHGNLLAGAESVSQYLENEHNDNILCLLPLSFDAGFSQLTTAFICGATAVLMNFVLPVHVPAICAKEKITGITGVPPLWHNLISTAWPEEACFHLRYFANTGGHMPLKTLSKLRSIFKTASPYLMYGLTEAFRSTYLHPSQVDERPDSIGKAIPNAEVLVLKTDGSPCDVKEIGELVHVGPTVTKGYWKAPALTALKYRTVPKETLGTDKDIIGVWSGDMAWRDEEGYLYFVGREDDMIKTSGYRVSPTEVEEVLGDAPGVSEAVVFGIADETVGQKIVAVLVADIQIANESAVLQYCRKHLPAYMVPKDITYQSVLHKNPNGKYDRKRLREQLLKEVEA